MCFSVMLNKMYITRKIENQRPSTEHIL
jgi:hypothetical protein